jgi:hypothetical protein
VVERVAGEPLGHACGVVVGGLESGRVFDEVEAEEERRTDPGEEARARVRIEIADRTAEEGNEPGRERVDAALEVAGDRLDQEPRIVRRQRRRAVAQGVLAHVDGDEALERPCERVEQESRITGVPRAELDERARARARDVSGMRPQDLRLAAWEVVLG